MVDLTYTMNLTSNQGELTSRALLNLDRDIAG